MKSLMTATVVLLLALYGCNDEPKHEHKEGEGEHSHGHATVEVPATYGEAVAKIESLKKGMGTLIEKGELAKVHVEAEKIGKVAEKLPELAKKQGESAADLKEVELAAKELKDLFDPIDKAADAGKKEETKAVFAKYDAPIARLKKHVGHAGHEGHDH